MISSPEHGTLGSSSKHDELLSEGQVLDREIGLRGKEHPEDCDDGSEDEHRHLV